MNLYIANPLDNSSWDNLMLDYENCSFFHSAAWATILEKTYNFKPKYLTYFQDSRPVAVMPFMEISSLLTGKKGISLPFSDFCDPIGFDFSNHEASINDALDYARIQGWKFIEWRTTQNLIDASCRSALYATHDICLKRNEDDLSASLKESCRRNIRKALGEGISVHIDQSSASLKSFYRLNCMTRKRHGLPPQPYVFFKNILNHALSKGLGFILTAVYEGKAVAASVFFHFGTNAIFKYGASDAKWHFLRANNLIMWEAMKWYRKHGYSKLNLGKTEMNNSGLLRYKRAWGGQETILNYYRYDLRKQAFIKNLKAPSVSAKYVSRVPCCVLRVASRILYKYVA